MMHNIQRPTLPDDMSEEFCRWEERIRLDQDGLPEHDIFRKIDRQHKYTGLKLGGVYGFYPRFTGPQRSTVKAAELGEIVLLGTNSYLGLATHPEVVEASAEATRRYGTGCSGSPLLNGTLDLHVSLEQELACFLGKPAAVLCSTGYQSNLAAISALCESGDMIIQDALNHRSLFDAARLSGADFTLYRHNDMDHLARVLRRTEGRRRIIVVDAVFSMEGTVADLATIAELADRHGCRVYVDESHALGVLGPDGRGASAALGVLARMDVVMARSANPLPPSAGSSPEIGPSWTTSGTTVQVMCFPPACRRPPRLPPTRLCASVGVNPTGGRGCWPRPSTWPPAWHGRAIRPSITEPRSCR